MHFETLLVLFTCGLGAFWFIAAFGRKALDGTRDPFLMAVVNGILRQRGEIVNTDNLRFRMSRAYYAIGTLFWVLSVLILVTTVMK